MQRVPHFWPVLPEVGIHSIGPAVASPHPPNLRRVGTQVQLTVLPLGLAASQLFDLRLFRAARIVALLERLVGFALLASGAFGFLTIFPA